MKRKKRAIILVGGGLDSTSYLINLYEKYNLEALFINYNQKAVNSERESIRYFCDKYKIPITEVKVNLNNISNSSILQRSKLKCISVNTNCLQARNLVFISLALTFACKENIHLIILGFHKEPITNPFPDATLQFIKQINKLIPFTVRKQYLPIKVIVPFAKLKRNKLILKGHKLDKDLFIKTHTCYEEKECGICKHCIAKKKILSYV